jgi:cobalamin biosynthesis protein CobD/CbiB
MSWLLAASPALPLHTAVKYVAGAYVVFLAIVLIYVAIMAKRLRSTERDLTEIRRELEMQRDRDPHGEEVKRVA